VQNSLTIALDGMGGDNAPQAVVDGAAHALERHPGLKFLLVGDEQQLRPLAARHPRLSEQVEYIHTTSTIKADEKPSMAIRSGKTSSMRLAIQAVKDGRAQGVVSGGNTGALMAMAKVVLRGLPGIARPAMASFFPTLHGESVMLDLGANLDCDSQNLVQFAILGNVFARTVFAIPRPSLGLLNVGTEDQKGHEYVRQAAAILRDLDLPMEFQGFIEGNDIAEGRVDVIVTDGWSGNIALKTAEGAARLMNAFIREAFRASLSARIGYIFAARGVKKLRKRIDPRRYNGAVFLGVDGIAVKSHGGSDAYAFATAIGVAVDMAEQGFIEKVKEELQVLPNPSASVRAVSL